MHTVTFRSMLSLEACPVSANLPAYNRCESNFSFSAERLPLTLCVLRSVRFLDSNNYASMAGDIPTSLQDLSIQSNPSLGGLLPAILCSSTSLKTCELQGTNLGTANAQNTTTTQVGAIATRVVNATATTTIMTTATAISTTAPRCGICRF